MSFWLGPTANVPVLVDVQMYDIRPTADGAIFDVTLMRAGGKIDWNHDLLATCVTYIGRIVIHDIAALFRKAC